MSKIKQVVSFTILTILGAITITGIGFIVLLGNYTVNQSDVQAASNTESYDTVQVVEEFPTLSEYEAYLNYSHTSVDGHWFYYGDDTERASVYVDFDTLDNVNPDTRYVGTFYDTEHWELESIRADK